MTNVDFKNHKVKTASGGEFTYSKVLFCTGGTPKNLPMPGFKELKNIFLLRRVEDVQKINKAVGENGKKIVVVGTGFIGAFVDTFRFGLCGCVSWLIKGVW